MELERADNDHFVLERLEIGDTLVNVLRSRICCGALPNIVAGCHRSLAPHVGKISQDYSHHLPPAVCSRAQRWEFFLSAVSLFADNAFAENVRTLLWPLWKVGNSKVGEKHRLLCCTLPRKRYSLLWQNSHPRYSNQRLIWTHFRIEKFH